MIFGFVFVFISYRLNQKKAEINTGKLVLLSFLRSYLDKCTLYINQPLETMSLREKGSQLKLPIKGRFLS